MQLAVDFEERQVGTLDWRADSRGVQVELDSACCGERILRVFAESTGAPPLYVGLPEPENGRLRLRRRLSGETLRRAGWTGKTPERVYLAEKPLPLPRTEPERPQRVPRVEPPPVPPVEPPPVPPVRTIGDAVLDALAGEKSVAAEWGEESVRLSCAFSPKAPFALAPAFVLCRVEGRTASLDWKIKVHKKGAAE